MAARERSGVTKMGRRERRTEGGEEGPRARMNGGGGGVLRSDCALSVVGGRKKRRREHGAQGEKNGGRQVRAEREEGQGLDKEWH